MITDNDTFRSYPSKIEEIYNQWSKVTEKGSVINLSPVRKGKMQFNGLYGDTLQDGTPTPDTPVEIQSVTGLQNVVISNSDSSSSNTYEVNLGKNIWSVGNKNVSWATNYVDVKNILNTLSEGTYSITLNFKVTEIVKEKTNNLYGFTFHNSNGHIYNKKNTNSNINVDDNFVYTYTFTISSSQVGNFTNVYFYGFGNDTDDVTARSLMYDCQLEKGSTVTSYSPYFTPIELNKIGTYQDRIYKDNGKWYVEKNIGRVVLDGTEDWTLNNNYTNNSRFTNNDDILNKSERNVLSNYFVKGTGGTDTTNIDVNGVRGKIMLTIPNSIATTTTALQTWLSTHNTQVNYILATPEYTEITNEELINQLEELYTAKSYDNQTNISVNKDLPLIISASALMKGGI